MKKWIVAVAGVAVIATIGVGAVMAQTPGAGTGTSFLDRVAQKLGITTPALTNAIKSARTDQIDQAVANGQMTQQQADALKQKLNASPNGGAFGFGGGFGGHMRGRGGPGMGGAFGLMGGLMGAEGKLATFLGIPQSQLTTELQAPNATLATVAAAHGKSRSDLTTFITNTAKSTLDAAVTGGKMTQAQETTALSQLSSHINQLIDGSFFSGHGGKGFPFGGGQRGPGGGSATPGASDPGAGWQGLFSS